MKLYSLLMALCAISTTGSLLSAEKQACLKFKLDTELRIVSAGEFGGMKFLYPVSDFLNKIITLAVPLSEDDQKAINIGLCQAYVSGDLVKVPYTLEQIKFLA